MQAVMPHRVPAPAVLLLVVLGVCTAAADERASGVAVLQPSDGGGITVEGMLEEGGRVRRLYSCPAHFIRMGNSCYFLSHTVASWDAAHHRCRALGAQLAVFEKRTENFHMRMRLMRPEVAPQARWIGGIYQWKGRFWMWATSGERIDYKGFQKRRVNVVDQDWAWHCVSMDPVIDYRWRATSCLQAQNFICETPLRHSRVRVAGAKADAKVDAKADAGTKHGQSPRGKDADVLVDKDVRGRPTATPSPVANITATPGSRRLGDRRPVAGNRTRGGGLHRHSQATRFRAPAPPPGPRRPDWTRRSRPRLRPIDIYPVLRRGTATAAPASAPASAPARRPQQSHGHGDEWRPRPRPRPQTPRRLPEMPDATVHTLYPPPAAKQDNNDFSNDV